MSITASRSPPTVTSFDTSRETDHPTGMRPAVIRGCRRGSRRW